jgi:RNA polymerase sigma-70 factor (ECF subfamily)
MMSKQNPLQPPIDELLSRREFNVLVGQYSERVYNHAYRMLGNREDAEEATMDVFLKVHKGLSDFRGDAKLSTWIWKITVNVCLSRRSKRKSEMVITEADNPEETIVDPSLNPEEWYIKEEAREELARRIAQLPEQEATAVALFYLEGMNYGEIAAILSAPPGTVATALYRGRDKLRRKLSLERIRT